MTKLPERSSRPVRTRIRRRFADESLPAFAVVKPDELRLAIKYVSPGELKPPRRALRNYSKVAKQRLKRSIEQFGFISPIVVDANGRVIVGHRRWIVASEMKLRLVPVVEVSHLTDDQLRLLRIVDNKLCEDGEWDLNELHVEFEELAALPEVIIEDTGFSTAEIDNLWLTAAKAQPGGDRSADDVPEVIATPVTRTGEVWQLGRHLLICGNALEQATFERLLGRERAQMVFCDAPYNLPSAAISGLGKHRHRDFAMAAGEMAPSEFASFLRTAFRHLAKFSLDGSIHYQCMDWKHMREMLDAGHQAYTELKNLVVWTKHSAGMGSFYRSQHELIFVWKSGTASHINNFGLGKTGRYRSNCWEYRGNSGFHRERDDELSSHATVKPWSMVADAIRDCSKRGGIILDAFGGAGTTLIAAERTGRKARLVEIDPLYCDVTVRRWEKLTGNEAVLVTGETFKEAEAARAPVSEFDDTTCALAEEDI